MSMSNLLVTLLLLFAIFRGASAEPLDISSLPIVAIGNANIIPRSNDALVTLRKNDRKWIVDQNSGVGRDGVEQVLVCNSCNPKSIYVMARPIEGKQFCAKGALNLLTNITEVGYNVCRSEFYKCPTSVTQAVVGWSLAIMGSRMCTPELDKEKILSILGEAEVSQWIDLNFALVHHAEYLLLFKNISKSADASKFASIYANDDPDNLIPQAEVLARDLKENEDSKVIAATKLEDEQRRLDLIKKSEQKELAAEVLRLTEIATKKARAEHKIRSLAFRKNIKLGDESHCGMVVDQKLPLVKIQTMVGERWFRLEQLYENGSAPCNFFNKVYVDIGSTYNF
jgi:hypothetical protein